jgi:hypothetical protein
MRVHHVGGVINRQASIRLRHSQRIVKFKTGVLHHGSRKSILEDQVGLFKSSLCISFPDGSMDVNIGSIRLESIKRIGKWGPGVLE